MDSYEEIIIRYLDRQLSDDERRKFENSLESDDKLRTEFENYKKVNELFSDDYIPAMNNNYFNGVIPEFRKRLGKEENSVLYRKYGMAFTTLFLMVTSFFIADKLFNNQSLMNEDVQSVVEGLSEEELNELANYFSYENQGLISDSEGIVLLSETDISLESIAANISAEEKISIMSEYDLSEVYSLMDSELLEAAYNEILSKRIF